MSIVAIIMVRDLHQPVTMDNSRHDDKGFTLIELLIVVTIIGILAAIAIPQFGSYRARAYNAAVYGDLRNFRTLMESYLHDSAQYPNL